ncbi:MAG: peroxidase [Pirellulales bacterium]|nr:peroxidase [Pirellulales bacterium]
MLHHSPGRLAPALFVALLVLSTRSATAYDRTLDGTYTHPTIVNRGAAGQQLIRVNYLVDYANSQGAMILPPTRPNARTISNTLSAQSSSKESVRGLSNFAFGWAQFLDHDMGLSTTSNGAGVNGSAAITITDPNDPLGPNPIGFTRSNFVFDGFRQQINEVTSWIDGSQIYGSSTARAAALRTGGGTGAKLLTSAGNLLPYNTAGLANQNNGPLPANQLFLAGDVRANENSLLTSLQTVFVREHNRLVDVIAVQKPSLNAQEQYNLARKLVIAELQAITYKEFLPALMGANAPTVQAFAFSPAIDGSVTNAFAHMAFRFGHSIVGESLLLANDGSQAVGSLTFGNSFFNPALIANDPTMIDKVLMGASLQKSQEVDLQISNSLRNVMFGPPGAGGTDLMAIDVQRGRDHGIVDYNELRGAYNLSTLANFSQMPTDAATRAAIQSLYGNNVNNVDAFVGALAETHLPGSSLGPLLTAIIGNQFTRSRDGDRFFYTGDYNGLYAGGVLKSDIASIVNLDTIKLADLITMNTGLTNISDNLFFAQAPAPSAPLAGDFNNDGVVDGADLTAWKAGFAAGTLTGSDLLTWQRNVGVGAATGAIAAVPEPSAALLAVVAAVAVALRRRRAPR